MSYKDYLGNELVVGDFIATTIDKCANLKTCRVIGFTPQKIRIEYKNWSNGNQHYKSITLKESTMVVKVQPSEEFINKFTMWMENAKIL